MRAMSTAASGVRHALMAATEALLIAAIVAALAFTLAPFSPEANRLAGTGDAAAAKSTGGASIALAGATAGSARAAGFVQPALGTTVYFDVAVPKSVNNPRVAVKCYQDGDLVYGEAGSVGQARGDGTDSLGYSGFLLGGGWSLWKERGGVADCRAELFYFASKGGVTTYNVMAATRFAADG